MSNNRETEINEDMDKDVTLIEVKPTANKYMNELKKSKVMRGKVIKDFHSKSKRGNCKRCNMSVIEVEKKSGLGGLCQTGTENSQNNLENWLNRHNKREE